MAYKALYREWRPALFEDVVEQEHVVKTLRHSVSTGRVAHAYLFCGTRGTGKTTMAHILSRAINCLNPNNGDPCNQCEICREILSGSCVDVLEIDAASNNSVDNVRAITDEVIYAPVKAKKKVYIIDEVHMLSTGAFNALLKTLEEPPEHVVFILATTEPHKLPATILSRCQRFDFRRITHDSIAKQLHKIASAIGTALDDDAAGLIARLSDGAMRDAISLLDQCISLGSGKITYGNVLSVVGIVDDTFMTEFAESMLKRDIPAMLGNIARLVSDGRDIAHFVSDLVIYFRNILICKVAEKQCDSLVDVSGDVLEIIKKQACNISEDGITDIINGLSALERELKWAANPRVMLEVTLIRLCGNSGSLGQNISERLTAIEKRLDGSNFGANSIEKSTSAPIPSPEISSPAAAAFVGSEADALTGSVLAAAAENHSTAAAENILVKPFAPETREDTSKGDAPKQAKADAQEALRNVSEFEAWPKIMDYLKSMGRMKIHSFLHNVKAILLDGSNIGLVFSPKESFTKTLVSKPEHVEVIEEAALKITGKNFKVMCLDEGNLNKARPKAPAVDNDLIRKARGLSDKTGLPLEIIDE